MAQEYEDILKYWYGDDLTKLKADDYQANYKLWFSSNTETDKAIIEKFGPTHTRAANGELEHWREQIHGSIALLILFDQFSRNIFRGDKKMFEFDSKAVEIANEIFEKHKIAFDDLSVIEKCFIYLVFIHSEDLKAFDFGIKGLEALSSHRLAKGFYSSALEHQELLKEFGRYSHRNEFLGRESTKEEIEFLKAKNYNFASSVKTKTPANN